ncbi:MAG TPA: hypothetical protein VJ761_06030 [Ktedonobacteraceae bacterium]|nr:hypothetical protein [Ktedonobacteraceae bacterium]
MNLLKRLPISFRLLVVVCSLFVLAALPMASSAQAAPTVAAHATLAANTGPTCSPTAVYVTPYFVHIGQTVTMFGCGFQPNAVVTISGGGGANGTSTADSNGNFIFIWTMARHLYKYCYIATATDAYSHTATNSFCDA